MNPSSALDSLESAGPGSPVSVSVIVPVSDRPFPLDRLYLQYAQPLAEMGWPFEFIFVMDDNWRYTQPPLIALRDAGKPIRILETGQTLSESAMLQVAAGYARARKILTLPSYPRVEPDALPQLLEGLDRGFDLVTAARVNRSDAIVNRAQRRAFHLLMRSLVGGRLRDVASGVRAMRKEVLEELDLYGDSFRFIPLLAIREGFRVLELDVPQHPDDRKTKVYSPGIYLRRLIDLLGLTFLLRFAFKPLRFFGLVGLQGVLAAQGRIPALRTLLTDVQGSDMHAQAGMLYVLDALAGLPVEDEARAAAAGFRSEFEVGSIVNGLSVAMSMGRRSHGLSASWATRSSTRRQASSYAAFNPLPGSSTRAMATTTIVLSTWSKTTIWS